ncbi:proline dehydrogenase family protein [Geodermatophilus sp. URMC 61]|uniref:proline dehydrogenase family protein n=1 Tax=Geodermatophilus sp. URMC 61 TaxID=3423411 RepID=UPI00406CC6B3
MVNRVLMWAAGSPRLQRQVTQNPIARRAAHRFVAGERLDEALDVATSLASRRIGSILDLLGEGVTDLSGATSAVAEYEAAAQASAARGLDAAISIKLSQLGQTVDRAACVANLTEILDQAKAVGVPVEIDMEDSSLVPDTVALFRDAATAHPRTRLAVQAALRRTPLDLETLAPLKPRVRLVKGAYAEPLERAHQGKAEIRAQFKYLTDWLFEHGSDPAFGTHDDELIAYARTAAARAGKGPQEYEFQFLHGIRRDLQQELVDDGHRVRVYIPFGSAWYPYLTRRMAERPANLLFFLRALVGR